MTHFQRLQEYDYTLVFPESLQDMLIGLNSYLTKTSSPTGNVIRWLLQKGVVSVPFCEVFHYLICDTRKLVAVGPLGHGRLRYVI